MHSLFEECCDSSSIHIIQYKTSLTTTFYDFYLTIWIGMLKSHLSTFWNFNLNSKKKLKWGVWNLKEVLNQNGTKLLAIRKWEHSNGSEMSWTSVEPKRKSSNREIQCLFQCANYRASHSPALTSFGVPPLLGSDLVDSWSVVSLEKQIRQRHY